MNNFSKPLDVSDLDLAFGGRIAKLMPTYEELRGIKIDPKWERLFSEWFFLGLKSLELTPKEGIDKSKAIRHIRAIMGSFEPKHEHKERGCAYLLSQFFEDAKWEAKERKISDAHSQV